MMKFILILALVCVPAYGQMLYMVDYCGKGTDSSPYEPCGASGNWSSMDLRSKNGDACCALLWLNRTSSDPSLVAIAAAPTDAINTPKRTALTLKSGQTYTATRADALLKEITLKFGLWSKLRPTNSGRKQLLINGHEWYAELAPIALQLMDPSDTFTGTGDPGANWTTVPGLNRPTIAANELEPAGVGGSDHWMYWSADAFPNNQFSEFVITTLNTATSRNAWALCRQSAADQTAYASRLRGPLGASTTRVLIEYNAGATTTLATNTGTVATGDTIRCEANGSTIRFLQNGTQIHSTTDATIASGSAGVGVQANAGATTDAQIASWNSGGLCVSALALLGVGAC